MKAFEFSDGEVSGVTQWIDDDKIKDGNGIDIVAYIKKDNTLVMYDAYLMIDSKQGNYVDLCCWYDYRYFEVPKNEPLAECVVLFHCPITKTL